MAKTPPRRKGRSQPERAEQRRSEPADSHDTPFDGAVATTLDQPAQSATTLDEAPLDNPAARTHPSNGGARLEENSSRRGASSSAASGAGSGAYGELGSGEQRLFPDWERFQILDFLGAGGMGSVFKARDPRLGRLVAIKFMRVGQVQNLETRQRQRFQREAQAQARLDHPHICKISGGCRNSDGIT